MRADRIISCPIPLPDNCYPALASFGAKNGSMKKDACGTHIQHLLRVLALQDFNTWQHTQRVTIMTMSFARLWNLPSEQLIHIGRGAQLHDIGKVLIPDAILQKKARPTGQERTVIQMHPIYAHKLLYPISCLRAALQIPYCHHEKWNGTGYPRGLRGRQIPFAARLFAIVDVWDALLSDRPYRRAWTRDRAIGYIRSQSGKHFDPEVVRMFAKLVRMSGQRREAVPLLNPHELAWPVHDAAWESPGD